MKILALSVYFVLGGGAESQNIETNIAPVDVKYSFYHDFVYNNINYCCNGTEANLFCPNSSSNSTFARYDVSKLTLQNITIQTYRILILLSKVYPSNNAGQFATRWILYKAKFIFPTNWNVVSQILMNVYLCSRIILCLNFSLWFPKVNAIQRKNLLKGCVLRFSHVFLLYIRSKWFFMVFLFFIFKGPSRFKKFLLYCVWMIILGLLCIILSTGLVAAGEKRFQIAMASWNVHLPSILIITP